MCQNMSVPKLIWSCVTAYVFFRVIVLERYFIWLSKKFLSARDVIGVNQRTELCAVWNNGLVAVRYIGGDDNFLETHWFHSSVRLDAFYVSDCTADCLWQYDRIDLGCNTTRTKCKCICSAHLFDSNLFRCYTVEMMYWLLNPFVTQGMSFWFGPGTVCSQSVAAAFEDGCVVINVGLGCNRKSKVLDCCFVNDSSFHYGCFFRMLFVSKSSSALSPWFVAF